MRSDNPQSHDKMMVAFASQARQMHKATAGHQKQRRWKDNAYDDKYYAELGEQHESPFSSLINVLPCLGAGQYGPGQ